MSTLEVNSIQPLSSGSTITLGASGKTLNIPSGCTISNSGSATGFGKIGQVVQTKVTDQSTSSSDSYFDITGFTFNFTPSATTSNVYLNCSISTAVDNHSTHETAIVMKLVRDSTDLQEIVLHSNYGNWIQSNYAFNFYDTAISTTSQVTYKFQAKRILGGQTIKFNSGYSTATNFQATFLTAMEVLA
tara:strand:- start:163 stop:726 length:564 start_codon:yes stop_codon:yes gene_type:complete